MFPETLRAMFNMWWHGFCCGCLCPQCMCLGREGRACGFAKGVWRRGGRGRCLAVCAWVGNHTQNPMLSHQPTCMGPCSIALLLHRFVTGHTGQLWAQMAEAMCHFGPAELSSCKDQSSVPCCRDIPACFGLQGAANPFCLRDKFFQELLVLGSANLRFVSSLNCLYFRLQLLKAC